MACSTLTRECWRLASHYHSILIRTSLNRIVVYIPNYESNGVTNTSTSQVQYTNAQASAFLEAAYSITTGVQDANYSSCIDCAVVERSRQRAGLNRTSFCDTCFGKYCYNELTANASSSNSSSSAKTGSAARLSYSGVGLVGLSLAGATWLLL